jgi:ribonuclease G
VVVIAARAGPDCWTRSRESNFSGWSLRGWSLEATFGVTTGYCCTVSLALAEVRLIPYVADSAATRGTSALSSCLASVIGRPLPSGWTSVNAKTVLRKAKAAEDNWVTAGLDGSSPGPRNSCFRCCRPNSGRTGRVLRVERYGLEFRPLVVPGSSGYLKREILISATPQESWVALMEDDRLVELMLDRPDQSRLVGDIYLGVVEAVLPGIQAAFVNIGTDKAGFLHVSDLVSAEEDHDDDDEDGDGDGQRGRSGNGRRSRSRPRKYPPIQEQVRKGDTLLVQVTKEPIGTKGPRLTAQISLPGRFLVYMPFSAHVGVSRKIDQREERARLRQLASEIRPDDAGGLIIRTVGEELNREKFEGEFNRLHALWTRMKRKADSSRAPAPVHREAKLVSGVIRDLFSDKLDALIVDNRQVHNEIVQYVQSVDPDLMSRIRLYEDSTPLFDRYDIEEEIGEAFQRRVNLDSGGYIIVEPTEALVSIDVNTGRFTGKGRKDPEETILRTNLDASREIARQLRLRDIGGIVVVDFIDMESQQNRDRVLQELRTQLGRDRARTRAFAVSELGLIEMTRQRVRPSLFQTLTRFCEHCSGAGRVFTPPTVVRRVERSLKRAAASGQERSIQVRVHPEVALHLTEEEPDFLKRLRGRMTISLDLRDDPLLREDEFRLLSGPAETDVTEKYVMRQFG